MESGLPKDKHLSHRALHDRAVWRRVRSEDRPKRTRSRKLAHGFGARWHEGSGKWDGTEGEEPEGFFRNLAKFAKEEEEVSVSA